MIDIDDIAARLRGLTFAEAEEQLHLFNSYERTVAMVFVMKRARSSAACLQIFLDWGDACDAPWWNRSVIADMLREACTKVSLRDLLEPADRDFYDAPPNVIKVWRGCEHGRGRGLSWTTDRVVAEGFALGKRCYNDTPTLVSAEIPKQHIFAVFTGRKESEIVLDPRRLRHLSGRPFAE